MGKRKVLKIELKRLPLPSVPAASRSPKVILDFVQHLSTVIESINSPIKWSATQDDVIELSLSALLNFLHGGHHPFHTMSVWDFLRQLKYYGFQLLASTTTNSLRYQHEHFKKNQPNLLNLVKFHITDDDNEAALLDARKTHDLLKRHRQLTDKCRMRAKKTIQPAVLHDIKWRMASKMLHLDREISKDRAIIPADFYKNPEQSQSNLMQNDYAGFYGNVADDAVRDFFESLLPVYSTEAVPAVVPTTRSANGYRGRAQTRSKDSRQAATKTVMAIESAFQITSPINQSILKEATNRSNMMAAKRPQCTPPPILSVVKSDSDSEDDYLLPIKTEHIQLPDMPLLEM